MNELTKQELAYLIKLLTIKRGAETRDVSIEIASLDKTEIYFLQQKLENQLNSIK